VAGGTSGRGPIPPPRDGPTFRALHLGKEQVAFVDPRPRMGDGWPRAGEPKTALTLDQHATRKPCMESLHPQGFETGGSLPGGAARPRPARGGFRGSDSGIGRALGPDATPQGQAGLVSGVNSRKGTKSRSRGAAARQSKRSAGDRQKTCWPERLSGRPKVSPPDPGPTAWTPAAGVRHRPLPAR